MRHDGFILTAFLIALPQTGSASELWKCTLLTEFPGMNVPVPKPSGYAMQIENSTIGLLPLGGDLTLSFSIQANTSIEATGRRQNPNSLDTIHLDKRTGVVEHVTQRSDGTIAMKLHGKCVSDEKRP